jgi:hypothetical protein
MVSMLTEEHRTRGMVQPIRDSLLLFSILIPFTLFPSLFLGFLSCLPILVLLVFFVFYLGIGGRRQLWGSSVWSRGLRHLDF